MLGERQRALAAHDARLPTSLPALLNADLVATRDLTHLPTAAEPCSSDFLPSVNQVVELAKILTGATGSAIALRGEHGTICIARSGEGAPPLGAAVDVTSGISRQCLESGIPVRCDDLANYLHVGADDSVPVVIRAVAVVPIYWQHEICGILGVFSGVPGAFSNLHLDVLQRLADRIGAAQNTQSIELASPRSSARLTTASRQMPAWNNVLLESSLPWNRFIESLILHVIVAGALLGLSMISPREPELSWQLPREAHVTYYPVSQSFPADQSAHRLALPKPKQTATHREFVPTTPQPKSSTTIATPSTANAAKVGNSPAPSPEIPAVAINRLRKPLIDSAAVPPSPMVAEAQSRRPHLPGFELVAPPPELGGNSGLRIVNTPKAAVVPPSPDVGGLGANTALNRTRFAGGSAGVRDLAIIPPAPSLGDRAVLTVRAAGTGPPGGIQLIGAPPSIETGLGLSSVASRFSGASGVSQVVPPPPLLTGDSGSFGDARSRSLVAGNGGSQVVPPPPSIQEGGNFGGGRGTSSLDEDSSKVIGPPPSIPAGTRGDSGTGSADGALARARAEDALPPSRVGNSRFESADAVEHLGRPSLPESVPDPSHRVYQDLPLRVIALAWAPARSSYFSNFEVFIAEKRLSKEKTEFIKLVYVFLPYQKRLSEYGAIALRIRRLRVTRDSSCDEDLMQVMWPEDQKPRTGSPHFGDAPGLPSSGHITALPCYVTTAEDYGRAVSRNR